MSQVFCSHDGVRVKTAKSLEYAVVRENVCLLYSEIYIP